MRPRHRFRFGFAALAATACLGATYASRQVFDRPGETALELVPASALAAVAIDLTPTPAQAFSFKTLEAALTRNDMGDYSQKLVEALLAGNPASEELKSLARKNGMVCYLKNPELTPDQKTPETAMVATLAITDGNQAKAILARHGRAEFWRGTQFWRLPKANVSFMVIGNYLVMTDKPWAMNEIRRVSTGDSPSFAKTTDFATVRKGVMADANVMAFVNPEVAKQFDKDVKGFEGTGWVVISVGMRDSGIAMAVNGKNNLASNEMFKSLASIKPVRSDLQTVLPQGAYGMFALAQPGRYMSVFEPQLGSMESTKTMIPNFEKGLKEDLGIDLRSELLPALDGNAILALYPRAGKTEGVDVLLMLDDTNGADPSGVAEKLQEFVDKQMSKEDASVKGKWFEQTSTNGAEVFRLNDKFQDELRKNLAPSDTGSLRKDALVSEKTVTWAKVGKSILVASSSELLSRAIASYQVPVSTVVTAQPSQVFLSLDFSLIAKGVRGTFDDTKLDADGNKTVDSMTGIFAGLKQPMEMRSLFRADGSYDTSMFIPVDVDKAIDMIGSMNKKR